MASIYEAGSYAGQSGYNDGIGSISTGTVFTANVDGQVTSFRWWEPIGWATETWTFHLWNNIGTKIVTQWYSHTGAQAAGWRTLTLTTPYAMTAGQTLLVSVYRPSGNYVAGSGGEHNAALTSADGSISAPKTGTVTFAGNTGEARYDYSNDVLPSSTYNGGAYFVDVVYTPTAAATPHGSATGSVTFAGSATGHVVKHGSVTGTVAFTGTTTGHKSPHGAVTGSLSFTGSATGHLDAHGSTNGSVAFTGTVTGHAPTVSATHGSVTGAVSFSGTASGHAPTVAGSSGAVTGSVSFSGSAAGHTDHHGSVSGSVAFSGASTGHAPTVGLTHGAVTGSVSFTGSASGHKVPQGSATGTVSFTGSVSGHTDHHGSATGTLTFVGAGAGAFSKGFPDLTVIAAVMAGWTALTLAPWQADTTSGWGAYVDMEEPINAKSPREYLRVQLTLPDDISVDVMVGATVQASVDGGVLQPATLQPGNIVYLPTGSETATPLAVGNHLADIYLTTADEKPVMSVGFTVV